MAYFNNPVPVNENDLRRYLDQELRRISDQMVLLQENSGDGGAGFNIDGGRADSIYNPPENIDGGNA